jgi:hypothetical protein
VAIGFFCGGLFLKYNAKMIIIISMFSMMGTLCLFTISYP